MNSNSQKTSRLPNTSNLHSNLSAPPPLQSRHGSGQSRVFRSNMLRKPVFRAVSHSSAIYGKPKGPPRFSLSKPNTTSQLKQSFAPPHLDSGRLMTLSQSHRFHLQNKAETLTAVDDTIRDVMDVVDASQNRNCSWKGNAYVGCHKLELCISIFLSQKCNSLVLESRKLRGNAAAHDQWFFELQTNLKSWLICPKRLNKPIALPQSKIALSKALLERNTRMLKSSFADTQECALQMLAEATQDDSENSLKLVENQDITSTLAELLDAENVDVLRLAIAIFSNVTSFKESSEKLEHVDTIVERIKRVVTSRTHMMEARRCGARTLLNLSSVMDKSTFSAMLGGDLVPFDKACKESSDAVLTNLASQLLQGF